MAEEGRGGKKGRNFIFLKCSNSAIQIAEVEISLSRPMTGIL